MIKENSLQKLIPSRNDIAYRKEKENEETRERTRDVVVTFPFKQHDFKSHNAGIRLEIIHLLSISAFFTEGNLSSILLELFAHQKRRNKAFLLSQNE